MLTILATLLLLSGNSDALGLSGRYVSPGNCPNITEKYDFDPVPYLGRWFELERFEVVFQEGMDCCNAFYSDLGDGYVEVYNTARTSDGQFTDITGVAHAIAPGVLYVEFPGHIPAEYHILDTDYENFSAVYNCFEESDVHWQFAWILSRTATLDQNIYDYAKQVFTNNGIDVSLFNVTYHGDDCPYPVTDAEK